MTYRIAEVAELVGVPATTLRYYEDIGLVAAPGRGENGYRAYSEADVERLRFVTATKNIGVPLSDVAELVKAYDVEDCSVVAHQVVEMVAARLAETQDRIAELVALAAKLQSVAARLADAPTAGPCGPLCPCATAATPAPTAGAGRTLVPLTLRPEPPTVPPGTRSGPAQDVPIACSLDRVEVPGRVAGWQDVVRQATRREAVAGGVGLTFVASAELAAEVARLAAAEQDCCAFFAFTVHLTAGELRLEVRAPVEAADVVAAMFGTPD